jgi:hypothetical protein
MAAPAAIFVSGRVAVTAYRWISREPKTMRYDAQSSLLSISFAREPEEHVKVMFEAGRRLQSRPTAKQGRHIFIGLIFWGLALGLCIELYRQYVLIALLHLENVPPLGLAALQLVPFVLLAGGSLVWYGRRALRKTRQNWINLVEPGVFVDTDIYNHGIRSRGGPIQITVEWQKVRNIVFGPSRIDIEVETFIVYIPDRAFDNRKGFDDAAELIQRLWQEDKASRKAATFAFA